jgi:hypothetical protein
MVLIKPSSRPSPFSGRGEITKLLKKFKVFFGIIRFHVYTIALVACNVFLDMGRMLNIAHEQLSPRSGVPDRLLSLVRERGDSTDSWN